MMVSKIKCFHTVKKWDPNPMGLSSMVDLKQNKTKEKTHKRKKERKKERNRKICRINEKKQLGRKKGAACLTMGFFSNLNTFLLCQTVFKISFVFFSCSINSQIMITIIIIMCHTITWQLRPNYYFPLISHMPMCHLTILSNK